jgi:hypothetical protein
MSRLRAVSSKRLKDLLAVARDALEADREMRGLLGGVPCRFSRAI